MFVVFLALGKLSCSDTFDLHLQEISIQLKKVYISKEKSYTIDNFIDKIKLCFHHNKTKLNE